MKKSILKTVRKMVGFDEDYTEFDLDLIILINSVFSTLTQLGVGPRDGFSIEDDQAEWTEFIGDMKTIESVKGYMVQKVRLMFDPPANSFLVDAIQKQCTEFEWRLNVEADKEKE